jgi:amidohydrolase
MNEMQQLVHKVWTDISDATKQLRWSLHQWPELGYQEFRTTQQIQKFLLEHGVVCQKFPNATGAVVLIDNHSPITIGLRVDIDALPITENTGVAQVSQNSGVMHACGHDMHTSIGAGVAVVATRLRDKLPVNVKIIFQPAEECNPRGGAKDMIAQGVLEQPKVSFMLGLHVWPEYRVGEIGIRSGAMMAASDKFEIKIAGVSSHAAQPHKGIDAIFIASEILNRIYKELPRKIDPFESYVITIGEIVSSGRYNIVCDDVQMRGTLRTFKQETRDYIHQWLSEAVTKTPIAYGGTGKLIIEKGYDVVENDKALCNVLASHAREILNEDAVKDLQYPSFIAEDFSVYSKSVPSAYFHLGCDCLHPLHSDRFLAKEEALDVGVELLSTFLLSSQLTNFIGDPAGKEK